MRRGRRRVEFPVRPVRPVWPAVRCFLAWQVGLLALLAGVPLSEAFALGPGPYHPIAGLLGGAGPMAAVWLQVWAVVAGLFLVWRTAECGVRPAAGCLMGLALPVVLTLAVPTALQAWWQVRRNGFARIAAEAEPVVVAIKRYESAHSWPPARLDDLVPDYLARAPRPNARQFRAFRYERNPWVPDTVSARPSWSLRLSCGWGLNFDVFVYWPTEQYPLHCYGGTTERFGRWIYVHE